MCLLSKGKARAVGDIIYQLPITHSSAVLWLLESTAAPCCPHPSYTGKWLSFKPKRGLWWLLVLRGVCRRGSSNKSPLWEFTAGILYLHEHPLGTNQPTQPQCDQWNSRNCSPFFYDLQIWHPFVDIVTWPEHQACLIGACWWDEFHHWGIFFVLVMAQPTAPHNSWSLKYKANTVSLARQHEQLDALL